MLAPHFAVGRGSPLAHRDCHVAFDHRLYSVPWTLVGQHVWLRVTSTSVESRADDFDEQAPQRWAPSEERWL